LFFHMHHHGFIRRKKSFQVSRPRDRYGKCHPSSQICRYTVRRMRTHVAIATIFI
jgi:hypothetical protein